MNLPLDTPKWVADFLNTIEEKAERQVSDSKTSDEAMKATGAYSLWRVIKAEVELEAQNQTQSLKEQRQKLHARTAN